MTVNPGAVVLIVVAIAAILIGLRGTQGAVFQAITGHGSGSAAQAKGAGTTQPAAAVQTVPSAVV